MQIIDIIQSTLFSLYYRAISLVRKVTFTAVELWNYHAIEAEDELFCLSISFLLVQVLRFQVTGVLATKSGGEPGKAPNVGSRSSYATT